jgi:hypothetical protein
VLCLIPYVCMLSPLPRQVRETKSLGANPSSSAFPKFRVGRLLHYRFRGLLSVYSRYGLQTRQVAYATLYTGGLGGFVTSTAAPIATGWSDPVPGRVLLSRCGSTPFHGAPKHLYYTGAADKAVNLVGCKSPHHQLPGRVVSMSDACGGNEVCSART